MSPHDRILISLVLLLVLMIGVSCHPNPQPEGLTPVPTLAPAAELALNPALEGVPPAESQIEPQPDTESGDPNSGAALYAQNCAACHGAGAEGGAVGPTLISAEVKAKSDDYIRQTLAKGIAGTAMPAWEGRLSAEDIEDIIAFLRTKQ